MPMIAQYRWEDDTVTYPQALDARQAWRSAVAAIATKARQALPDSNGRIDKAVEIVLAGDVEVLDGGKARVASQSNGTTTYVVCNGECECRDFPKAPLGQCKHRIARGIAVRAHELAKTLMDGQTTVSLAAEAPEPTALAEPASPTNSPTVPSQYVVTIQGKRAMHKKHDIN